MYIWRRLICRIRRHDWHYFNLETFDGGRDYFRCCMWCEQTETIGHKVIQ